MSQVNPLRLAREMRDAYLKYFDTAYWLDDEQLMAERRSLLEADGTLFADVLLEPVLRYPSNQSLDQVLLDVELPQEVGDIVGRALFPFVADDQPVMLRDHQADAVRSTFRSGRNKERNPVITSGTGSGKTESFLLPILLRLAAESMEWGQQAPINRWWESTDGPWRSLRESESRPAAIRALVLYPTNALVEDQMTRLRRAIWRINANASRAPLWFGRYTGVTLGNGALPPGTKLQHRVANEILSLQSEFTSLRDANQPEDVLAQFPDPGQGEMVSRWDMISAPPDILVTNYSMVNVMLMRDIEDAMFTATKAWLAEDPSHVFTLVVDELHLYRGTAGSEVALILRNLLNRLDLDPASPQLRVIATSASLTDSPEGRAYLEQFFAIEKDSFQILKGNAEEIPETDIPDSALDGASPLQISQAISAVCWDAGEERLRATPARTIAERLFGSADDLDRVENLLDKLVDQDEVTSIPLRSHLFVRSARGLWACSSPVCSGVPEENRLHRSIGQLFSRPTTTCPDCFSRVLEVLYCYECGDVSLGGYIVESDEDFKALGPLDATGESGGKLVFRRTLNTYTWYRPGVIDPEKREWTHKPKDQAAIPFSFTTARYEHRLGVLSPDMSRDATGLIWHAPTAQQRENVTLPALPDLCPNCGYQGYQNDLANFFAGTVRSPIRAHTAGQSAATELYLSQMLRSLSAVSEDDARDGAGKTIVFTDSRDDAARTAIGVATNHHRDLIRQLIRQALQNDAPDLDHIFDAIIKYEDHDLDAASKDLADALKRNHQKAIVSFKSQQEGNELGEADFEALRLARDELESMNGRELGALVATVTSSCIDLGINPVGPNPEFATLSDNETPWNQLYQPPESNLWDMVSPAIRANQEPQHREEVVASVVQAVFDRARRDIESVGLGFLTVNPTSSDAPLDEVIMRDVLTSVIRILGISGRYGGSKQPAPPADKSPAPVRNYLTRVAALHAVDLDDLMPAVEQTICVPGVAPDWILATTSLASGLRLQNAGKQQWRCTHCNFLHLHSSGGVCANRRCASSKLEVSPLSSPDTDYYAWLAQAAPRRLAIAELTGQTKPLSEQRQRQRRFKDALIGPPTENRLTTPLDVLSVTTTMEVGVDIGSLQSTVMANMPPQRFNYQQRVGRAGRSGQAVSYAVTLCRDRTHDDYYFTRSEKMTGDTPPQPFLDLSRERIVKRVVAAECLRRAFKTLSDPPDRNADSIHGTFGQVVDWPNRAPEIATWLTQAPEVETVVKRLCEYTGLDREAQECIVRWAQNEIVLDIEAALETFGDSEVELSKLLATAGVLPMFGFPSKVRQLFEKPVRHARQLDTFAVSDRSLDVAISSYAPGSEVVRDGWIHTATGFAAYDVRGQSVIPKDPLGPGTLVGRCEQCNACVLDPQSDFCPVCQASLTMITMYQPRGFRTDYKKRPYDDDDEESPTSAGMAQLAVASQPDGEHELPAAALQVYSQARLVTINDNNKRGFRLLRRTDQTVTTADDGLYDHIIQADGDGSMVAEAAAIGEIRVSDALVVKPKHLDIPMGKVSLIDQRAAHAAFWSMAEALRHGCRAELDLDPKEIVVGLQPVTLDETLTSAIFVADALDNGAGYALELGDPDRFNRVLANISTDLAAYWADPAHSDGCDSSCPDCLRSYDNRRIHGHLDWRLGLDMVDLLANRPLDVSRWLGNGLARAEQFADSFDDVEALEVAGLPVVRKADTRKAVFIGHPLWRTNPAYFNDQQAEVADVLEEDHGFECQASDFFVLERNPLSVYMGLQ